MQASGAVTPELNGQNAAAAAAAAASVFNPALINPAAGLMDPNSLLRLNAMAAMQPPSAQVRLPGMPAANNLLIQQQQQQQLAAALAAAAGGSQPNTPSPANGGFNSLNSSLGYGNNSLASPSISGKSPELGFLNYEWALLMFP